MAQVSVARDGVAAFRHNIRALEREVARQLEADTACCGVTLSQCHTLLELSSGATSLSGLVKALDLDLSTLSRTVDSLVRVGFVERTVDPSDRRAICLGLTDAGRAKVDNINAGAQAYYAALLAPLSEKDRRQASRVVQALAEGMRRLRESATGEDACRASQGPRRSRRRK
jgi:DNA-binding MarR family transcriptional regulator